MGAFVEMTRQNVSQSSFLLNIFTERIYQELSEFAAIFDALRLEGSQSPLFCYFQKPHPVVSMCFRDLSCVLILVAYVPLMNGLYRTFATKEETVSLNVQCLFHPAL